MKIQQGFTLIELMIVVAIIAILAAIAISQYQDYVIRSQVSEGSSLADGVKTAVAEFHNNYGRFPNTLGEANASLGLASSGSITGSYVAWVSVCGADPDECVGSGPGAITAAYSNQGDQKANVAIHNSALEFVPTTHAGSMSWVCQKSGFGGNRMKDKWLPASCR